MRYPSRPTASNLKTPTPWLRILRITAASMAAGAAYGWFSARSAGAPGWEGLPRGAFTGGFISLTLASFTLFFLPSAGGAWTRRLPFLLHIAFTSVVYLAVILLGLRLGQWWLAPPESVATHASRDLTFAIAISFTMSFLLEVNVLLGQNVLVNFVIGKYRRPRVEERIFLFIDLEGSTRLAEKLGEVDFHRMVNRFISDIGGVIAAHGGEIHKYVGDELIATWPVRDRLKDARCVRACIAARRMLHDDGASYERDFGMQPDFRAGLHRGPVVVGEVGFIKKEIVFLGDTVNTAARIQEACRTFGERCLASAALLDALDLPADVRARSLGAIPLRGKATSIELRGLDAR